FVAHALDKVVLDAAAGDGTDHAAIVANRQGGADGTGAGAPGLDDSDKLTAVARRDPGGAGFQYFEGDAIHARYYSKPYPALPEALFFLQTACRAAFSGAPGVSGS